MRLPPLAIALSVAAAAGATAAVATAQDVPPFEPEPTTTTTTTTEPAPVADDTAPVVAIRLPAVPKKEKFRIGRKITSLRITMKDPDSSVQFAQVDVKRRIRLNGKVRDQAYDGKKWWTTTSATKYRIYPTVGAKSVTYTLKLKKGLPAARYWITVKAQNDPGEATTERENFRTR